MICEAMARAGHEVVLYATQWPALDRERTTTSGDDKASYSIMTFPAKLDLLMPYLPHSPGLVRAVKHCTNDFSMIINHSLWNPVTSGVMRNLRRADVRYCLMPHGMLDPVVFGRHRLKKIAWAFLWERANVEGASMIIFNSAAEKQKARGCGWNLPRTFVLPHLIHLAEWKELPPRSDFEAQFPQVRGREVVLFVGRIDWVKNLDKLIEALAIARAIRPSAMLVCVGPDSHGHRAELEKLARAMGVYEHLLFTGILKGERLKAAFAHGDAFALVSKKENFGLVAAEALSCGLPVVLGEGVDLGKDWPSGGPVLRVSPKPKEIAHALVALLERSASRGLPDAEALALAEREFKTNSTSQLLEAYSSMLTQEPLDKQGAVS